MKDLYMKYLFQRHCDFSTWIYHFSAKWGRRLTPPSWAFDIFYDRDGDYTIYCDVCGQDYYIDEPCQYH